MIGSGQNKLDVSGIKMDCDEQFIDDVGEGLGVAGGIYGDDLDFIEGLEFTGVKPKKSKTIDE